MSRAGTLGHALGRQVGGHTTLYGIGAAITFAIGMANIAVLTRFLTIEEFGELAVLLVFAALLTVLYNLATLQGTYGVVFGATEEDDDAGAGSRVADKRAALTTGLVLTLAVATAGTVLVHFAAEWIAPVLGDASTRAVQLAASSGAAGAVWRFVSNVPRYERRPLLFVALGALRPLLVLGISIPLVVSGAGVAGVLAATAIGTMVAAGAVVLATLGSYSVQMDLSVVGSVVRRGALLIPVILSFWIVHNVDLYLVSVFADDADAGRYRVAARIAAGMSYFVSAFLMAWMPLSRTVLHTAVERERGRGATGGALIAYFWAACMWIVLALALLSDVLVRVAPATYASAAPLIPIIGLGFVAYGVLVVLHRGAQIQDKRRVYTLSALAACVVFLAAGLALVPTFGSYGAAVAPIVGFAVAVGFELVASQRGRVPLWIPYRKLAAATALAALCFTLTRLMGDTVPTARLALDIGIVIGFPFALWGLGLVQPPRAASGATPLLPQFSEEWLLADVLIRQGRPATEVAATRDLSEAEVLERFGGSMAQVASVEVPPGTEVGVARYLLADGPAALRDDQAKALVSAGVDPTALVVLERAHGALAKALDGAAADRRRRLGSIRRHPRRAM